MWVTYPHCYPRSADRRRTFGERDCITLAPMPILQQSVQALLIFMWFGNTRLSSGTAFVVQGARGPLLITNRHNVTGRDQNTGKPIDTQHGAIPDAVEVVHNVPGNQGDQLKLEWRGHREPLFRQDGSP